MKKLAAFILAVLFALTAVAPAEARLVTRPVPWQYQRLVNGASVISDSSVVGSPWGVTSQIADTSAVVDLSQAWFNSPSMLAQVAADSSFAFRFILVLTADPNSTASNFDSLTCVIQSSLTGTAWQTFYATATAGVSATGLVAPSEVLFTFNNTSTGVFASGLAPIQVPKAILGQTNGLPMVRFIRKYLGNNGGSDFAATWRLYVQFIVPDNAPISPTDPGFN